MKKEKNLIYLEYAEKYKKYGINPNRLEYVENVAKKRYNPDCGLNLDMFIRTNLYFDVLSNMTDNLKHLPQILQYKALVLKHNKYLCDYLTQDEMDIIFEDTLDDVRKFYDRKESLGSYIIRNYKNNIIDYINDNYDKNYKYIQPEDCQIKLLR